MHFWGRTNYWICQTSSGCPYQGASSTSWTTWGLALLREARRAGLGVDSACRGAALEDTGGGGWWMVHHAGAGYAGSPRSAAVPPRTAGQSPRRCRRTAQPGRWGHRESVPCRRPSSLPGWARDGVPGPPWWTLPSRGTALSLSSLVERGLSPCAASASTLGTILVHLFECLGLVNLQDSHGVQGKGCLAHSTISFGRERGRQLTDFGRETRTVPPSDGVLWAQVHHDRSLHLGNACVPPGIPAMEGSEDGGDGRVASGRQRGHPRLCHLLMLLREKKAPEQSAVVNRAPLWETNHPAASVQDWAICWPPARYSQLPGQAWPSALDPVRRWRQHPRGAAPPHLHPQRT